MKTISMVVRLTIEADNYDEAVRKADDFARQLARPEAGIVRVGRPQFASPFGGPLQRAAREG